MAAAGLGVVCRSSFPLSPHLVSPVPLLLSSPLRVIVSSEWRGHRVSSLPLRDPLQVRRRGSAAAVEVVAEPDGVAAAGGREAASAPSPKPNGRVSDGDDGPRWKKLSSKELGIKTSMITRPTKSVMNVLRKKGHEVYLVGGCVRDLILKRTPKDFNVITSAELKEALFSNLDRLLTPDRSCHNSLWVAMLTFHQALVDEPRDPLVIATFTLALHNRGDLSEAVKIARRVRHRHDVSFPELLEPREMDADELAGEVLDLLSSVKSALSMMTDEHYVSQAMAKYPQAPLIW